MGLSAQSTTVHKMDKTVSHRGQVCRGSLERTGMDRREGRVWEGAPRCPAAPLRFLSLLLCPGYAPGHGPGVATSGSSSTFVSKRRNPRRS